MSDAVAVMGTIWGYRSTRDGSGGVRVTVDLGEIDGRNFHRLFPNPHGMFVAIAPVKVETEAFPEGKPF